MKQTQRERVIARIKSQGFITRNECLRNYISRLGAIICDLKKEGWDFSTKEVNGDYIYTVINHPTMIVKTAEIVEIDGKRVGILVEKEIKI